jgi:hypothetical protein
VVSAVKNAMGNAAGTLSITIVLNKETGEAQIRAPIGMADEEILALLLDASDSVEAKIQSAEELRPTQLAPRGGLPQ